MTMLPDAAPYLARAETRDKNGLKVTVSVLGAEESRGVFGKSLAKHGIQPLWLQFENETDDPVWYLPVSTDPDYFSPLEVAYRFHGLVSADENRKIDALFVRNQIRSLIAAHSTASGFLFTNIDTGLKITRVLLVGRRYVERFSFALTVPGPAFMGEDVKLAALYPPERVKSLDLAALHNVLAALPCCATDVTGTRNGDPLNLVIIESQSGLYHQFVERGWHLTERLDTHSVIETVESFLFGRTYLSSPVSPLFLFGRREDTALQKVRRTINQRNHLRLWLAPFTIGGRRVWVGQISRDIGIRPTDKAWYFTTHKIGPNVDFDRDYLLQDLLVAGLIERFGLVEGVGAAPSSAPRRNLTGDPYFTDGLRLVVFLSDDQTPIEKLEVLPWAHWPN